MLTGSWRTVALVAAIAGGALLPQLHGAVPAVRWLVMAMLGIVFLGTRFSWRILRPSHGVLLAANLALGLLAWGVGWLVGGRDVALAAFFVGISPSGAAAPVVMRFLGGRVEYVVAAFMLTNVVISALLPVLLPVVLGRVDAAAFLQVGASVARLVFLPLAAALVVRAMHPPAVNWPARLSGVSFGMWLAALVLIAANASHFIRAQEELPGTVLVAIGATTATWCLINFVVGRFVGGREFGSEASQALGQKNTSFTIYLALTYASPLVALGPTFYVICHNLWNSWQLHGAPRRHPPANPISDRWSRSP